MPILSGLILMSNFFETLHAVEMDWIYAIQSARAPLLDSVFSALNLVDTPQFALLLIPLIWYGVSQKAGARLCYILAINGVLNWTLKHLIMQPRPIAFDPNVPLVLLKSPFGMPSGGAQSAVLYAFLIACALQNFWGYFAAINIFFWLSFSRVYLGLHFPTDIVGGWIAGLFLVATYFFLFPKVEDYLSKQSLEKQLSIGLFIPFFSLLIPLPFDGTRIYAIAAFCISIALGLYLCSKTNLLLPAQTSLGRRLLRISIPLMGTFALTQLPLPLVYLEMLEGLWISYFATRILKALSL